jgi:hypothetical protein
MISSKELSKSKLGKEASFKLVDGEISEILKKGGG